MLKNIFIFNTIFNDAPQPWQLGFQDSAAPGFTGLITLHNTIGFYLIVICFGVFWVLASLIYYFNSNRSPIVYKYLNHGKVVPIQKCFKFNNNIYIINPNNSFNDLNGSSNDIPNSVTLYEDAYLMIKSIMKENKGKSGIYK